MSAYNEEKHIEHAAKSILELLEGQHLDYELLIFDDGSDDQTSVLADKIAGTNKNVKVIHNSPNRGLAYIAREGIKMAQGQYVTWFSGDNSIEKESMGQILKAIGEADILIAYMANDHIRSMHRKVYSKGFRFLMNTLFQLNLRYYTGPSVYPVELVKTIDTKADGYDFFAELLIRCLKKGAGYKEIPFVHKNDNEAASKAISLRNVRSSLKTICVLIRDLYFSPVGQAHYRPSKSLLGAPNQRAK